MLLDSVELPDDLEWVDEFAWTPVAQDLKYGATGSLFIQESVKQAGRPISLQGEADMCWVPRQTVLALRSLAVQPGKVMTLTLGDGRSFQVRFFHAANPVDVSPVVKGSYFGPGDYFKINAIKLIEV